MSLTRRVFLQSAAAAAQSTPNQDPWTTFQIACMTLPYSPFPFERALKGIAGAGYRYVAWGTTHEKKPLLAADASLDQAKELGRRTRGFGMEIVMMFSGVHLEAPNAAEVHIQRIRQAAAAGVPHVLTFGKTSKGEYEACIRALKTMGPVARDHGVTVLIKQHGGNSATGRACSRILAEVGDPGIQMAYDAGNVLDYENDDPIEDIRACWRDVRAFTIKDHRNWPKDEDCGPGFGEIDHYKLLATVMRTKHTMPLACENIFAPLVPRPDNPEGVDALARRAREFLETVIAGLRRA